MSDYSERGAAPIENAAVEDPPTLEEVLGRRWIAHPDQAHTSKIATGDHPPEAAVVVAGGEVVDEETDGSFDIEGPNSA